MIFIYLFLAILCFYGSILFMNKSIKKQKRKYSNWSIILFFTTIGILIKSLMEILKNAK
jgi:hypothetical protein